MTGRANYGIEPAVKHVAIALIVMLGAGCAVTSPWRPAPRGPEIAGVARGTVRPEPPPRRAARGKRARAAGGRGCPLGAVAAVVAHVNAARASARLRPLVADPQLTRAAQARAAAMAARNKLSHSGWEEAIRGEVAVASAMGENVAYNYPTADAVVDGWMRSSGHRANILARSFHRIGVGCVADARARLWWAQDFAD